MLDPVVVSVNGNQVTVRRGATVAAAVVIGGHSRFRRSTSGDSRGPLCGMGMCFECRLAVDGVLHLKSCQIVCKPGMQISTDV